MTHKQRKALARRKAYEKQRNELRNNSPKVGGFLGFTPYRSPFCHVYRLWNI